MVSEFSETRRNRGRDENREMKLVLMVVMMERYRDMGRACVFGFWAVGGGCGGMLQNTAYIFFSALRDSSKLWLCNYSLQSTGHRGILLFIFSVCCFPFCFELCLDFEVWEGMGVFDGSGNLDRWVCVSLFLSLMGPQFVTKS